MQANKAQSWGLKKLEAMKTTKKSHMVFLNNDFKISQIN